MNTNKVIETNTEREIFGIHDEKKDEFIPIKTDKDIKKYAKKFNINVPLMEAIVGSHNELVEAVDSDLSDIWQRLDNIENK